MVEKKEEKPIYCLRKIGFSYVMTVILATALKKYLGTSEIAHSGWSILIFAAIYVLLRRYESLRNRLPVRRKRFLALFCIGFALTEMAGLSLTREGSVLAYDIFGIGTELLIFAGTAFMLFLVLANIKEKAARPCALKIMRRGTQWVDWLILMVGWLPVLLAYYPGIFAYDASNQVTQVLTGSYSTHHPLLHTLLLGGLFRLGHALGDNNLGVLLYSLVQMGIVAWAISWALAYMRKKGMPWSCYIFLMAFYIFFPVNAMLAISTTKDILFAAFCLIVVIFLMKISEQPELWKKRGLFVGGCLALSGMMLFRNNAMYACILCCPFLCLLYKQYWKKYLEWILVSLAITMGVNLGLGMLLQPEKGSIVEMLSVPLQQMARAGYYYWEEMEEELAEELNYFIPKEVVSQYAQNGADMVKNFIEGNRIKEEPFRFIKLYIQLGADYPREYLDAFACLTQGYWYMEDTSHAQIYGVGMESRLGYMLTNYKTMPEGYEVTHVSFLPQLEYLLEKLFSDNKYLEIPMLAVTFSPAFWGWMLLGYLFWQMYHRHYRALIPILPLACYHLTLLLGPVCIVRYVYPVIVCMPVVVVYTVGAQRSREDDVTGTYAAVKN